MKRTVSDLMKQRDEKNIAGSSEVEVSEHRAGLIKLQNYKIEAGLVQCR